MQAISPHITVNGWPLTNPLKYLNDVMVFWSGLTETASRSIIQTLQRRTETSVLSPTDRALEQFKQVQWLLYQRHLKRWGWQLRVPPVRECWRFIQWSDRHSGNFRHLLALYQSDWFKRYADLTVETVDPRTRRRNRHALEKLLREIECHLYQ